MKYNYILSVRLMTFNHSEFILKCLEGIAKQQTNFVFEVVVGDDFSKDNNLALIEGFIKKNENEKIVYRLLKREYNDEYYKLRQKNGRIYNLINIMDNCQGKYTALLDGDDYWTDPNKLQKQVDFLEANTDYVIACHRYNFVDEESKFIKADPFDDLFTEKNIYEFDANKYLERFVTQTCTMVFEKKWFDAEGIKKYKYFRDKSIYYELLRSSKKKGALLNDIDAVYRIQNTGVYSSLDGIKLTQTQYKVNFEIFLKNIDELRNHRIKKKLKKQNYLLLTEFKKQNNKEQLKLLLKDAYYLNSFFSFLKLIRYFLL